LKKQQQFYILKFTSERLKKAKYNIEITVDEAKNNQEIITINNSELLRVLFRYKDRNFDQKELDNLLISQKKLRRAENSEENRKKLIQTNEEIENMLFVEDLVSIEFKHRSHYLEIVKNSGFYINNTKYVPFLASAGMIRKNTALFINNNIKHQIMDILENGRDETVPMVAAKFGAYFSLYSSSTLPVSFPTFAVVPDKLIPTMRKIDFVTYIGENEDDDVTELDYELKQNAWDGQGLISPRLAKQWSEELELDYTFSCAIIRAPFLKGLVAVFDLEKFANEVAKKYIFKDIYGKEHDIRHIDLIISESMFKLFFAYKDTDEYIKNCHKNQLGFSIAKVNPKIENSYSRTSYQFLQVLNLNDSDIAKLCEPTVNWFRDISGGNAENMLLYATGETKFQPEDFDKMDVAVKAILLNPELARDRYIQGKFIKSIEKKKREAYMGSILINANYQFMIADPFYQACHIFGLKKKPLLKDGEHYSEYWNERDIKKVAAIRSPIIHHSELNVLNFKNNKDTWKWYQHIHSGIIFPANGIGIDCVIHGGADFDGDLICTINNPIIIKGKIEGIPVVYESKKSEKELVDSRDDKKQVESQLKGHNSKVGFATNISSSMYALMEEFPKDSLERRTIEKRLKIGRVIQGEIIDGVKGLSVPPFRNHWTKYKKITEDMTAEEKEKQGLFNQILCDIRPSFFRFLYPHYMSRYNKEIKRYDIYSMMLLGKPFKEIIKNPQSEKEWEIVNSYKNNSFFLENNSVMNKISRYMRTSLALIGRFSTQSSKSFDYRILQNPEHTLNAYGITQMKATLEKYKSFKKGLRHDMAKAYENLESYMSYLKKECYLSISSNESELADYAIEITYGENSEMVEFAWKMFPSGVLENIFRNASGKIHFPVPDKEGEIEYLWNRYKTKEINIGELYEK